MSACADGFTAESWHLSAGEEVEAGPSASPLPMPFMGSRERGAPAGRTKLAEARANSPLSARYERGGGRGEGPSRTQTKAES